jgi:CRISPR-associated protein Cmr4
MILATTMLYLYVETPLHAGTGSGLSSIELPIQRERITQYPMIQSSGIKGKLRTTAYLAAQASEQKTWTEEEVNTVFGPENNGADHAGALILGDARILLFPVRSLNGVFAYTTSCTVLSRFARDMARSGQALWGDLPEQPPETPAALVTTTSDLTADNALALEEFSFDAHKDPRVDTIARWIANNALPTDKVYEYWRKKITNSLVILPENDFRDFVVNATEIITRIRIDPKTKTVDRGMLWTEEHLPQDTLLYVPVYATDARKQKQLQNGDKEAAMSASAVLQKTRSLGDGPSGSGYLQLGGDETVGRGLVRMRWS